jgi:hypothetical protein
MDIIPLFGSYLKAQIRQLLKASCHEQAKFIYGKQKKINNGA